MAPPGEALRMAQQWGPAADTPWGAGRRPREASADHTGADQALLPSPTGQGHGLGRFRGRGCDGGLRALEKGGRPGGLLRGGGGVRRAATGPREAQREPRGPGPGRLHSFWWSGRPTSCLRAIRGIVKAFDHVAGL